MKMQFLNAQLKFVPITIVMIFLIVHAESQNVSANEPKTILVEKKAPSEIMISSSLKKYSYKKNNFGRRINKTQNNQLSFDHDPENEQDNFVQENLTQCQRPSKSVSGFEGNPETPFFLPPVGYYSSASSIAISNAGKIVSISNGWIRYYDERGKLLFSDSLYHFCLGLINTRVLYDPKKDRFVFVSLYGYTDFGSLFTTDGMVAAFSKSNDPLDGWNFYYFPDSLVGDDLIADYPQLGISNDEIFITDIRLDNDGNIIHSDIVQVDKNAAYAGLHSIHSQIYPVSLSGDYTASIVPAIGGSTPYGPNMYFIMADESGSNDDLYYIFEVTNTIFSDHASLKTFGPVHSGKLYSPAPLSMQPHDLTLVDAYAGFDDFMQNAFYENGVLQFCQNSAENGKAAVCIGRIIGILNKLSCKTQTIAAQNLSLSFAQIAYAGNGFSDNSSIAGIEYTGNHKYPGLASVFVDNNFSVSALMQVKSGQDTINSLWGNYSALCPRYNHPGQFWMEGQYGDLIFPKINWIAQLKVSGCPDQTLAIDNSNNLLSTVIDQEHSLSNAPNPFSNLTNISFSITQSRKVSIQIFDLNRSLIKTLANSQMQAGAYHLTWNGTNENGSAVANGIYYLKLNTGNYSETKKLSLIK